MLSLRFCRRCLPEIGLRRPFRAVFFFVFSSPLCLFARYAWVPGLGCPARFWPQFVSAVFFFPFVFSLVLLVASFFWGFVCCSCVGLVVFLLLLPASCSRLCSRLFPYVVVPRLCLLFWGRPILLVGSVLAGKKFPRRALAPDVLFGLFCFPFVLLLDWAI